MLENNNHNSEINLNLKVPPEQEDGSFSMKDLVLTLYNARKVFLIWCCIGLVAGIVGAGAYYMTGNNAPVAAADEVSVMLTLNYDGAEQNLFPNGAAFDTKSFYAAELWESVLRTVGKDDVTAADAIRELKITQYDPKAGLPEGTVDTILSPNGVYELTIAANSRIFANSAEKEAFLQVFCEEYKNAVVNKYFIEDNVSLLYNQKMREWDDICREIIWDPFDFGINFGRLSERYLQLADILDILYADDPSYKTANAKSFSDYAKEFRDICNNEIEQWKAKLNEKVYIRSIDRFKEEYQFQIESMKTNREYYMELVASYSDLLASFQQKDAQGARIQEAVDILKAAQTNAETAASLQKQAAQMSYNLEMVQSNEQAVRSSSSEAETALNAFITGLESNQELLRGVIYDYYKQMNGRDAESSVIYTSAAKTPAQSASGVSTTRLLMIFMGLTFVGFAVGFCAAFVKKYLPQKA